jgi:hypothetical protein
MGDQHHRFAAVTVGQLFDGVGLTAQRVGVPPRLVRETKAEEIQRAQAAAGQ